MAKVLISDELSREAISIFENAGIEVDFKPGLSAKELNKIIYKYQGLAIRSATKVTSDLLSVAPNLKVVGRAGIGVDNVDVSAATACGVLVMNTPFGNAITTAEHAIAMMLALTRQIPQAHSSTVAGMWEKAKFLGTEITNKKLGIIGCGNIGSIVANRALGLKMRVVGYDPFLTHERAKEIGIEKVDLNSLLSQADFITLHAPLTESTRNIISADALNKTKKGVRIINCARGGLIDELALFAALNSGHVAGAALDVFSSEPAKDNILFEHPDIIATPHLGASTVEAQEKVALQIAEQMSEYLKYGAITNALNMASVTAEEAPVLKPYMSLGRLLGEFLGQVDMDELASVRIEFDGKSAYLNEIPVTASILAGLFLHKMDTANLVNAAAIAATKGIEVSTVKHDRRCDYETMIRVSTSYKGGERSIVGTLVGGNKPRIIKVQGISVESDFPSDLLYVRNYDRPGFIGAMGSLLGELNINIATFHLGRKERTEEAIALIEIDGKLDQSILAKVRELPQVVRADYLQFSS